MNIKLALTDDHRLVRQGLKMLLENFPVFKVIIEAGNGKELLAALAKAPVLPHIALVDVSMPVMNGFETTKNLSAQYPDIKVVALSVHDDLRSINTMINMGAHAYLLKDSSPEQVKNTLLHVHEEGFFYDQLVIDALVKQKEKDELEFSVGDLKISKDDIERLLNSREIEFIKLSCSDRTYKEIADEMNVGVRSIDHYRDSVYSKFQIKTRIGLFLFAIKVGLVKLNLS